MLLKYFGFREDPFGVTPDPRCLYQSQTHCEALASLKYGFLSSRGFITLIAPPGMGKTTLLMRFLEDIRLSTRSAFLFDIDHSCEPREVISYILRDLGIVPGQDAAEMHQQLNNAVLEEAQAGRSFVVVIDEAQNLSDSSLEVIRMLTNFETGRSKLIQIVLAGQPQLAERLRNPALMQLRQRITTFCKIEPLSSEQTRAYIDHRLRFAGYAGAPLFSAEALEQLAAAGHGVPRIINNLCFNALSLCAALKGKQVDCGMVAEVIADQQLPAIGEQPFEKTPPTAESVSIERPKKAPHRLRGATIAAMVATIIVGALVVSELWVFRSQQTRYVQALAKGVEQPVIFQTPAQVQVAIPVTANIAPAPLPIAITVKRHQSLRNLAIQYLGAFDEERERQILSLNPELTDPNRILEGQTIWFPARQSSPQTAQSTEANEERQ